MSRLQLRSVAFLSAILAIYWTASASAPASADPVAALRVESVVPLANQPQESDKAVIWYDDFNGPDKEYGDATGKLDPSESFDGDGKSLPCRYGKGEQGRGDRKVFFGDYPTGGKIVRRGQHFDEVYWRVYVKHQPGWTGGGEAKLSRATSLVAADWSQAMIAHVWSSGLSLTLDPASGVAGDKIITRKYNDFARLHWLGNKPAAAFPFSSPAEAGWWVCVESYAKLNTPGKKDGVNRLWIDGRLEAERTHLDWRGSYVAHGINAVFLESYWNSGSPVEQTRWIDNFVISTKPIGPVVCPVNPVLIRTPWRGPGKLSAWEVELAAGSDGTPVVWHARRPGTEDRVTVDAASGEFRGTLTGKDKLASGAIYYCRLRQQTDDGVWSQWSAWHQGFGTSGYQAKEAT